MGRISVTYRVVHRFSLFSRSLRRLRETDRFMRHFFVADRSMRRLLITVRFMLSSADILESSISTNCV